MLTERMARTGYHEAGHAAACIVLGYKIELVSRRPEPGQHGEVLFRCGSDEDAQAILLAPLAEAISREDFDVRRYMGDIAQARSLGPDITAACRRARLLVREPRYARVRRAIDGALLSKLSLTGEDVERALA